MNDIQVFLVVLVIIINIAQLIGLLFSNRSQSQSSLDNGVYSKNNTGSCISSELYEDLNLYERRKRIPRSAPYESNGFDRVELPDEEELPLYDENDLV